MPTRSPIAKRRVSSPCLSTMPTTWWPGITGDLRGGNSPSITCKSVLQTPQARTRTSISPLFGWGIATSPYSSGFVSIAAGALNRHAFTVRPQRYLSPFDAPSLVLSTLRAKYGTLEFESHRNHHVHRNHRAHRHDRSARPERGWGPRHDSRPVRRAVPRRFKQHCRERLLPDDCRSAPLAVQRRSFRRNDSQNFLRRKDRG